MTYYVIHESYDVAPLLLLMYYLNQMCDSSMTHYVIPESYDVAPLWPLM